MAPTEPGYDKNKTKKNLKFHISELTPSQSKFEIFVQLC